MIVLASLGSLVLFLFLRPSPPAPAANTQNPSEETLPSAISPSEYASAKREFEATYQKEADRYDVLSWLAEANFKAGRWQTAAACFEQIPSETPRYGHFARLGQGRALLKLFHAPEAEKNLREFLRLEEQSPELSKTHLSEALFQLDYLLGIELRFEDRKPVLRALIQLGAAEQEEVLNYCFPSLHRWNGSQAVTALEKFWKEDPRDPRLRVALGRYRTGQGRLEEALAILHECRQEFPKSVSTAAALLACLHEQNAWEEMSEIVDTLPPPEDDHPWLLLRLRGHYHNHAGQFAEAVDCFQRVLKSNAADAESWIGLGTAYAGQKDAKNQLAALNTARELSRIQNRIGWALGQPDDAEALLEIAVIAADIDLAVESRLVVEFALRKHPRHQSLLDLQQRLDAKASLP
jgi:tetratricopeptide (TPR) repeat protein